MNQKLPYLKASPWKASPPPVLKRDPCQPKPLPLEEIERNASPLGYHWLVECMNIPYNLLDEENTLESMLVQAANMAGATVLGASFHRFEPQGVSGVVLLAESHLTIHTWPEYHYAAVDLFSCSDHLRIEPVITTLMEGFGAGEFTVIAALPRGVIEQEHGINHPMESKTSWRSRYEALLPAGMDLKVEIHECSLSLDLETMLSELLEHMGGETRSMYRSMIDHRPDGSILFACFPEGHVTLEFVKSKRSVRVNLFSHQFVDPPTVARQLQAQWKGIHHTFSCVFRK